MADTVTKPRPSRLTAVQWVICAVAALGFAFDTYHILVLPLIVGPALLELGKLRPGTPEFNSWVGLLFYVPAVAGGIFGLIGGYLADLLGRRRVLVWSILLYAVSALAAGYVTWLAESFPDRNQRENVLGYTQALSSIGGVMVTAAYYLTVTYGKSLPAIHGAHEAWRYTLMSGVIPAIPLIIIRPFLPESPAWQQKQAAGTLKRPSFAELFSPELRRTTLVTTLMFAMSYGAAFGAIQHIPRIVPALTEVKTQVQTAVAAATKDKPAEERERLARTTAARTTQRVAADVTKVQEVGGLIGRCLLAMLAGIIIS